MKAEEHIDIRIERIFFISEGPETATRGGE
jgi:hypothetical protein